MERRTVRADLQVREQRTTIAIKGYAARFDSPARGEVVRRTAFNKTLNERDDVRLLVNHDGVPIARTKPGTLTLGVDTVGLWVDAPSLDRDNPTVQELASAMKRKDIDQMSFAFQDLTPLDQRFDDNDVRQIREVKLFDVSVVTFPWYEDTQAELNALDGAFAAIRSGSELTREQRELLCNAIGQPAPARKVDPALAVEAEAIKAAIRQRRAKDPTPSRVGTVLSTLRTGRRRSRHPGA